MCDKQECEFRRHLEKILGLRQSDSGEFQLIKENLEHACNNPEMKSSECCFAEARCCEKFPACATISQCEIPFMRASDEELLRIALGCCTSIGERTCIDMYIQDVKETIKNL